MGASKLVYVTDTPCSFPGIGMPSCYNAHSLHHLPPSYKCTSPDSQRNTSRSIHSGRSCHMRTLPGSQKVLRMPWLHIQERLERWNSVTNRQDKQRLRSTIRRHLGSNKSWTATPGHHCTVVSQKSTFAAQVRTCPLYLEGSLVQTSTLEYCYRQCSL